MSNDSSDEQGTNDDDSSTTKALIDNMYNSKRCGQAMKDRSTAVTAVQALQTTHRPELSNVYGNGVPLLLSDIPVSCRTGRRNVVLGIDEAGRGPLLGPMTYGMAFWSEDEETIPKDFNDSKQLTEAVREKLFQKILTTTAIGFAVRVLHASEISRNMLRAVPYNLNVMSHNAAMELIQTLVDRNDISISTAYIDTVGNPESYKAKLQRQFPSIDFVVESKADDNYAPCSAASIVAKVTRDRMVANWVYSEPALRMPNEDDKMDDKSNVTEKEGMPINFGSGYPSDPACKAWMKTHLSDPIFGYCDTVRFSWGPAKKTLKLEQDKGETSITPVRMTFAADIISEDATGEDDPYKVRLGKRRQQEQMMQFLKPQPSVKRMAYLERRNLRPVTSL